MNENRQNLRNIVTAGIFAALICIITYFIKLPLPQLSRGAYINLGDTAIYIIAALINPVYAMFAAGIGSGLADLLYGGGVYIPATVIIKGLMGYVSAMIMRGGKFPHYIIACITGGVIMVLGYGLFETMLYGLETALASSIFNLIQLVGGVLIALPCYFIIRRINISAGQSQNI